MTPLDRIAALFPLWLTLASAAALIHPALFTWFSGPLIPLGLGAIMLGMGLTLSVDDFRLVAKRPGAVAAGFALQYTVMPAMGFISARLFDLPPAFATGLILVACCPGGTASNVITWLAKADVPLSVTMTTLSTLAAAVMTPLLTKLLVGQTVPVNAWGLFASTVQVVLLPVVLGVVLNRRAPGLSRRLLPAAPLIAVVFIVLIVASIVGAGRAAIIEAGPRLLGAVFVLHAGGFGLGYVFTRLLGLGETSARTISIEVGMQNSGLGVVLARSGFADPLTAIPPAISSVFHSLIGSTLAAFWARRGAKP